MLLFSNKVQFTRPDCNWTTKFRSQQTSDMEPSATSTTDTGEHLQAGTEDAPILDRPVPLRRLHDFGARYKYQNLLTYLPSLKFVLLWKIQKIVTDFECILNKLLTCSREHFEVLIWHLTVVRQSVSRLLTFTDWLAFWNLSDDVSNQQLNVVQLNAVASWRFCHQIVFVLSRLYFHILYTYLSKIISLIFLWQVT